MNFIQRNFFTMLRVENFKTTEATDPMTTFKKRKIAALVKNMNDMPNGEVALSNPITNSKLAKIQLEERHSLDTNVEAIYLLRLIVSNINATLSNGIPLRGIIQLGQYLRTRGDKVDFVKLDNWLHALHIVRMAQLQGSILITFFHFEADEIPFVHNIDRGAYKLTLRSLYYNQKDFNEQLHISQGWKGIMMSSNGRLLRRNLKRSMRYLDYAPTETICHFLKSLARTLSEIEE